MSFRMANVQPSIGKWFPVALLVGVLAGLSVYITIQIGMSNPSWGWFAAPWVLFISWGAWFSIGAKMHRMTKFIAALTGGVVFGWLTLFVNAMFFTPWFGATLGLPLTVVAAATCIVLLELTSLFELAFIYFFTYAGYFAYVFGGFAGQSADATGWLWNGIYFWILLMVGVLFAVVNVYLKNMLFNVERVPLDQRNTLFDKEM